MNERFVFSIIRFICLVAISFILAMYLSVWLFIIVHILNISYSILIAYDYHLHVKEKSDIEIGKFLDQ